MRRTVAVHRPLFVAPEQGGSCPRFRSRAATFPAPGQLAGSTPWTAVAWRTVFLGHVQSTNPDRKIKRWTKLCGQRGYSL